MVLADPAVRTPPPSSLRGGRGDGPRRAASSPAARSWLRLALFAAGLLVAFGSLGVVLAGWTWWFTVAFAAVLLVVAIGVARTVLRRRWATALAAPVVGVVVLTLGFAPDVALLGVVPTFDVFGRWGSLGAQGFADIAGQRTPADATDGIRFLLVVLVVVAVAIVGPLLDRVPAIAALPVLVVLDVPVAVRSGLAEPVWFVLAAVAYLLLLRVGRRRTHPGGAVALGALAIVGALVLPFAFPPAREPVADPGGGGFGSSLNPLIDLGDDLRRETVVRALSYTTDAPGGLYLRLATLDEFNGINWEPDAAVDPDSDVAAFPAPPGLDPAVPRLEYSASIAIDDTAGRWLSVPYPAVAIDGLEGEWRLETDGFAVRATDADLRGQEYDVRFLDVEPDRGQLLADGPPTADDRYRELPGELPAIIQDTAREVAGAAPTAYERALALQGYFTGGDFVYSLDAPVEQGYDGSGVGVIARFLVEKSGYCVHYASAMAVMARTLGLPSRVVVGFQPGSPTTTGGVPGYAVDTSDLHAWPEIWVEGVGWLRFEPTPGRGALPDYSFVEGIDDPATPEVEGGNPSAAPSVPVTAAPEVPDDDPEAGAESPEVAASPAPVLGAVVLGVLALLLTPAAVRGGIRWRRMRAVRDRRDAEAAWAEIRDTAHDHDWSAPDSETVRELGARLALVVGPDAVRAAQRGVEAEAYDRPGSSTLTVDEVHDLRRAIAAAASWPARLRATFLPPSLLARLGFGGGRDDETDAPQ